MSTRPARERGAHDPVLHPRPAGRFPAAQRLRKRPEFVRVQSRGHRVHTSHFVLIVCCRAEADSALPARLGVTASRRVGKAVVRNRAKRLVREAFRSTRELWEPGIDVVVIVKQPLVDLRLADVVREWLNVSRQVARRTKQARQDAQSEPRDQGSEAI